MAKKALIDRVQERLRAMDPLDFEALCADLLTEIGFVDVRRQASGTQFGHDISAELFLSDRVESWMFECKRYSATVPMKEIANKILWAEAAKALDYFVVMTNAHLSNDFAQLLRLPSHRRFKILPWSGPTFRRLLEACPATVRAWFGTSIHSEPDTAAFLQQERRAPAPASPAIWGSSETVEVVVRSAANAEADDPCYAIIQTESGQRLAKIELRNGTEVHVQLPQELLGRPVRISYDLDPYACVARHYPHVENIVLTRELTLPSQNLNARINLVCSVPKETWTKYMGTFFPEPPSGHERVH